MLTLPNNSGINTEENRTFPILSEYGYMPFRELEYRKSLKEGDRVTMGMDNMAGEDYGIVLLNNGTVITVRIPGRKENIKNPSRLFWVRNGKSISPGDTREGWRYYFIATPLSFGTEIIRIIELPPEYTEVISNEILENQSNMSF